jgi:hypothetical protein
MPLNIVGSLASYFWSVVYRVSVDLEKIGLKIVFFSPSFWRSRQIDLISYCQPFLSSRRDKRDQKIEVVLTSSRRRVVKHHFFVAYTKEWRFSRATAMTIGRPVEARVAHCA